MTITVQFWAQCARAAGQREAPVELPAGATVASLVKGVFARWPVSRLDLVHRVGRLPVGEASLWIRVIAGHRKEAFAACEFLISELKKLVPMWKLPPADRPD
jgi:molybdopterin synthase catalytic subunit